MLKEAIEKIEELAKPIKYKPTIWEKVRNVNENNENRY